MTGMDLVGMLRRIRRTADVSQRELAECIGVSKSAVAAAESGTAGLDVRAVALAAELAGLRLTLVDGAGRELPGMDPEGVRDKSGRRFPAHLDTRHGDQDWWHDAHRYSRDRPWYTFDRDRARRDATRLRDGLPADHQRAQQGDSPAQRSERRRLARSRADHAERQRRLVAGELDGVDLSFACSCPPRCDELDDRSSRPVHAPDCACGCDLG
jgi:transcriptional regulator with XRE-family HTH domain